MTNFIYNMQDELFDLNMILPVGKFSPIKKLVDHIEAQGKQLRELNAAITKRNKTIEKYEREKKDLQERNSCLYKKVVELNNGIRNSEDLTWKQKYEALLHGSEQAIAALQKKCQEYKNDAVPSVAKAVHCPWGDIMVEKNSIIKELEEEKKAIEKRCREAEKALEDEKQVSKDLNTIINSKNKLLDEYMTKYNNLERNYKEEVRMKENLKATCFRHERTIESQNSTIKYLKGKVSDYVRVNNVLRRKLESIDALTDKIDDVILSEE